MSDSRKEPVYYTVERKFLAKTSADELIKYIIQSHILQELEKEAEKH